MKPLFLFCILEILSVSFSRGFNHLGDDRTVITPDDIIYDDDEEVSPSPIPATKTEKTDSVKAEIAKGISGQDKKIAEASPIIAQQEAQPLPVKEQEEVFLVENKEINESEEQTIVINTGSIEDQPHSQQQQIDINEEVIAGNKQKDSHIIEETDFNLNEVKQEVHEERHNEKESEQYAEEDISLEKSQTMEKEINHNEVNKNIEFKAEEQVIIETNHNGSKNKPGDKMSNREFLNDEKEKDSMPREHQQSEGRSEDDDEHNESKDEVEISNKLNIERTTSTNNTGDEACRCKRKCCSGHPHTRLRPDFGN